MNDIWFYDDVNSTLMIRTPSNRMEGVFKLYQVDDKDMDSTMIVKIKDENPLVSHLSVRTQKESDLRATMDIKYRGNDDQFESFLEVIGSTYLDSYLEIRPNNRMFGIFEILPPPRVLKEAFSTEDSTTRSRPDLMTINYGDSQRMMVGRSTSTTDGEEYMESFIKFGNIKDYLQDLQLLEKANLRLYYVGDFIEDVDLSLYLPDKIWYEYGITHANRPSPIELITSSYTINTVERYVEFDIKELVMRWRNEQTDNFGLIIASNNKYATSFYTREGRMKPFIDIKYISNKIYSPGRADINSTMFIIGGGDVDINGRLTVDSTYTNDDQFTASLYVHRAEYPVPYDVKANLIASKPDQHATMKITIRDEDSRPATLTVYGYRNEDKQSKLGISKPDFAARLTVDPNISLEATLMVRYDLNEDREATFAVSREELVGTMRIIGINESPLEAIIEVPNYSYVESTIGVSRDELLGFFDIHNVEQKDATLYVKEREYMTGTMFVRSVTELISTMDVKYMVQVDGTLTVSKKNLHGFLYPRISGEDDIETFAYIRARDASDLGSYLSVGGLMGAYYFII
ncbi:DNRLRE domain-containing protein [Paenibacillus sp. Mc5Re-14]|uniref:DNRLRE domain-containing protein n=1 Tax=Paenibacillus sp. Mc5Re-14 TaxID=1030529 RepID=UPI000AF8570E|nr:DNRLRE domain-containing protein [Paenibacillus sp. Mc5Re-14]